MNKIEHLLTCLIEECAEVQKEATKALRFGLEDIWKDNPTPSVKLAVEFGDLLGVFEMLKEEGVIPELSDEYLIKKKKERVLKYMQYAVDRGTLIL